EDDAREAVLQQLRHGHRHAQIRLPSTSWAYTDHDIKIANRVDVLLLHDALRGDDALVRRDEHRIQEDVPQLGVAVARQDAERVVDVGGIDRTAAGEEAVELPEDA